MALAMPAAPGNAILPNGVLSFLSPLEFPRSVRPVSPTQNRPSVQ